MFEAEELITRAWLALCNPGQRRAIQALLVTNDVDIGHREGRNFCADC
jgi:hypothetical protein